MIEFSYRELAGDMRNFAAKERVFLSAATPGILEDAAASLEQASRSPHEFRWEIDDSAHSRIETAVSIGECEIGDNVAWTLKGTLAFRWDIQRTTTSKGGQFRIVNATTRIRLFTCKANGDIDPPNDGERAVWRFEIGNPDHPGTRFHSQVNWPHFNDRRLEVPRLPSIVLTPLESLDFLLGELFQRRWPEFQSGKVWQNSQRSRLMKLLEAATTVVTEGKDKSALMHLKGWKPSLLLKS